MAEVKLERVSKTYATLPMSPSALNSASHTLPRRTGESAGKARGEPTSTEYAVRELDLTIQDQEFLVMVGPSGCGKSTTLRLIAGLEQPTSGTIRIGGRDVTQVAPQDRNVAMVFQNYALYPHLSVYRNLALGLELRLGGGFGTQVLRRLINPRRAAQWAEQRQGIAARVRQTAERLGITHLLDRKPHQLSGGERQRVALGRAIVRNPAAFLFDEPLSNLDAKLRQALRTELKELHRSLNNTMVYVTHDQIEAMTLGQRVAVLNRGELQQVAEPTALYEQPANLFVAQFFGATPLNLARGRWAAETGQRVWRSRGWEWRIPAEHPLSRQIPLGDGELIMGVRAEDITIQTGEMTADAARAASPPISPPVLDSQVLEVDHWGDSCVAQVQSPERDDSPERRAAEENWEMNWHVRGSAASGREWRRGRPVKLVISPERIMWFDSATHKNLMT